MGTTEGRIVQFPTGTLGVDKTAAPIPASAAKQLYQQGYRFALRSIGIQNNAESRNGPLTSSEIQDLWGAGIAVSIFQVTYMQTIITATQGSADGNYMVQQAQALGFPQNKGFTLWFDLEGPMQQAGATALQAYMSAWADAVVAGGYAAGLYAGKNSTFSWQTLSKKFNAFWQAGAYLSYPMPLTGYQMYQLYPIGVTIAGIRVDIDVVQKDFQNNQTTFWGGPATALPAPAPAPAPAATSSEPAGGASLPAGGNEEPVAISSALWTPDAGTLGLDRSDTIAHEAASLYQMGYRFAIRTVGLNQTSPGVLTASEVSSILEAGMALGIYQVYSLDPGYITSAEQGTIDGAFAAQQAADLGAPPGLILWYDFEMTYRCSAATMQTYLNNWAAAVCDPKYGYKAGLYVGGQKLIPTSVLSNLPLFRAYWMAACIVDNSGGIARGYQMYQLLPYYTSTPTTIMADGINIDGDVVQKDNWGDLPTFWRSSSAGT